jgi:rare lipoprotein A
VKKFIMGCAVAGLVALLPKSQAQSSPPAPTPVKPAPAGAEPKEKHQVGVASWYGEEFQGKTTASGQPYDANELTAAHRTLPLGTTVRVTNLENHRNLLLRITDRGPYIGRRLIDVSRAAAKRLDFIHSGTASVRVEVVAYPNSYGSPSAATATR